MTDPAVIAHRGYAGLAPENTIEAARRAGEHDATDAIEIDVQPAADGTPVVIHDHRLDGSRNGRPLTDAEGLVWETPLEQITSAEVLESGETVPTLDELLEAIPRGVDLNVELKSPGTQDIALAGPVPEDELVERRDRWLPFVDRVIAVCDRHSGRVIISSFAEPAIAAVAELAPDYDTAPICWGDPEVGLTAARRHESTAVHPRHSALDDDFLRAARDAGIDVNVWTLEDEARAETLADRVDGMISDVPLEV